MSFTLPTEKPIVLSYFQKYDVNNSTVIGLKELSQLLNDLGFQVEQKNENNERSFRDLKKKEVKAIATLIDRDCSKSINFEEFYTWWLKLSGSGFSSLTKKVKLLTAAYDSFVSFDQDKSGYLDFPDEFEKFYQAYFQSSEESSHSKEQVAKELDKDNDGKVSFQELVMVLGILN